MIKDLNKELIAASMAILVEQEVINEGSNDYEELHGKILKNLHKEYPEMNVKNSKHIAKQVNRDGSEWHKYEADIPVHDSVKHLFKELKAVTDIHNSKDEMGNSRHHATLAYNYSHHDSGMNSKTIAQHFNYPEDGKIKTVIKHDGTGAVKGVVV